MTFTHTRAEMAHALGLSETRLQQFTALGIAKRNGGLYDPLETAFAYIGYLRRDEESKAARTRQVNAKALQIEQRVRREQRHMFTVDELRAFSVEIFESAMDSYQSQSSLFYTEYRHSHDEQESLKMTHRLYDPLRRIALGWHNGIIELIRQIDEDRLPAKGRLDLVLRKLTSSITAANKADGAKIRKAPA